MYYRGRAPAGGVPRAAASALTGVTAYEAPPPPPPPAAGVDEGRDLPPPTPSDPDLSVLPVPRAAYEAPTLSPIAQGDKRYPVARALELLVRARTFLSLALVQHVSPDTVHDRAALVDEITAFLGAGRQELSEDATNIVDTLSRQPGSAAGQRAQRGAVMPQPPPPPPAFVPPTPRPTRSPPYSNGCAHPGTRLQPNGRGVTCLDCTTDFPGFRP